MSLFARRGITKTQRKVRVSDSSDDEMPRKVELSPTTRGSFAALRRTASAAAAAESSVAGTVADSMSSPSTLFDASLRDCGGFAAHKSSALSAVVNSYASTSMASIATDPFNVDSDELLRRIQEDVDKDEDTHHQLPRRKQMHAEAVSARRHRPQQSAAAAAAAAHLAAVAAKGPKLSFGNEDDEGNDEVQARHHGKPASQDAFDLFERRGTSAKHGGCSDIYKRSQSDRGTRDGNEANRDVGNISNRNNSDNSNNNGGNNNRENSGVSRRDSHSVLLQSGSGLSISLKATHNVQSSHTYSSQSSRRSRGRRDDYREATSMGVHTSGSGTESSRSRSSGSCNRGGTSSISGDNESRGTGGYRSGGRSRTTKCTSEDSSANNNSASSTLSGSANTSINADIRSDDKRIVTGVPRRPTTEASTSCAPSAGSIAVDSNTIAVINLAQKRANTDDIETTVQLGKKSAPIYSLAELEEQEGAAAACQDVCDEDDSFAVLAHAARKSRHHARVNETTDISPAGKTEMEGMRGNTCIGEYTGEDIAAAESNSGSSWLATEAMILLKSDGLRQQIQEEAEAESDWDEWERAQLVKGAGRKQLLLQQQKLQQRQKQQEEHGLKQQKESVLNVFTQLTRSDVGGAAQVAATPERAARPSGASFFDGNSGRNDSNDDACTFKAIEYFSGLWGVNTRSKSGAAYAEALAAGGVEWFEQQLLQQQRQYDEQEEQKSRQSDLKQSAATRLATLEVKQLKIEKKLDALQNFLIFVEDLSGFIYAKKPAIQMAEDALVEIDGSAAQRMNERRQVDIAPLLGDLLDEFGRSVALQKRKKSKNLRLLRSHLSHEKLLRQLRRSPHITSDEARAATTACATGAKRATYGTEAAPLGERESSVKKLLVSAVPLTEETILDSLSVESAPVVEQIDPKVLGECECWSEVLGEELMSSDDEDEIEKNSKVRLHFYDAASEILDDVREEFQEPRAILSQFLRVRRSCPEEFASLAYQIPLITTLCECLHILIKFHLLWWLPLAYYVPSAPTGLLQKQLEKKGDQRQRRRERSDKENWTHDEASFINSSIRKITVSEKNDGKDCRDLEGLRCDVRTSKGDSGTVVDNDNSSSTPDATSGRNRSVNSTEADDMLLSGALVSGKLLNCSPHFEDMEFFVDIFSFVQEMEKLDAGPGSSKTESDSSSDKNTKRISKTDFNQLFMLSVKNEVLPRAAHALKTINIFSLRCGQAAATLLKEVLLYKEEVTSKEIAKILQNFVSFLVAQIDAQLPVSCVDMAVTVLPNISSYTSDNNTIGDGALGCSTVMTNSVRDAIDVYIHRVLKVMAVSTLFVDVIDDELMVHVIMQHLFMKRLCRLLRHLPCSAALLFAVAFVRLLPARFLLRIQEQAEDQKHQHQQHVYRDEMFSCFACIGHGLRSEGERKELLLLLKRLHPDEDGRRIEAIVRRGKSDTHHSRKTADKEYENSS